jgi:predicted transcriptional regulator
MSSKTRTRKNRTTKTGSTPALRPVRDQTTTATARTEAEDKLWEALRAHPNNTAPFLAGAANIGRSTAGKILAKWTKDGSVTRTPGIAQGGGRAADLWAITATHTTAPANDTTPNDTTSNDTAPEDAIREETSASNPDPAATPIYSAVPADSPSPDTEPTEPAGSGPAETANTESRNTEPPSADPGAATDPAPDTSDTATTTPVIEPDVAETAPPAADSAATEHAETDRAATGGTATGGDTANDGTAANGDTVGKQPRLAPGALEGKVEDFLREHPDDEFGPAAIAKKLARSSGAVSNALDRLVAKGTAVQTKASPKRYALAKGERTAAAATS